MQEGGGFEVGEFEVALRELGVGHLHDFRDFVS